MSVRTDCVKIEKQTNGLYQYRMIHHLKQLWHCPGTIQSILALPQREKEGTLTPYAWNKEKCKGKQSPPTTVAEKRDGAGGGGVGACYRVEKLKS